MQYLRKTVNQLLKLRKLRDFSELPVVWSKSTEAEMRRECYPSPMLNVEEASPMISLKL